MAQELTVNNFNEIIKSDKPVLVDFWASWCGPCKMLAPVIDELSAEYEGKVTVGKVNVDAEGELASQYAIVSIPTVIIFKDGKEAGKFVGVHGGDDYRDALDRLL